jgi:hypothetical protein
MPFLRLAITRIRIAAPLMERVPSQIVSVPAGPPVCRVTALLAWRGHRCLAVFIHLNYVAPIPIDREPQRVVRPAAFPPHGFGIDADYTSIAPNNLDRAGQCKGSSPICSGAINAAPKVMPCAYFASCKHKYQQTEPQQENEPAANHSLGAQFSSPRFMRHFVVPPSSPNG